MIQLISRKEVFAVAPLADYYISEMQKAWRGRMGNGLADYFGELAIKEKDPFDHLHPLQDYKELTDDFAVVGFVDRSKADFMTHRSNAFIRFFEQMDIKSLYLIDELNCDWIHFDFKSREKRAVMQGIVLQAAYHGAFEMDTENLTTILPLFHFSGRFNMAIAWFFSANSEVSLGMFLCDDGNFHTYFFAKDREKIASAAASAGLMMGGLEVCRL